MAGKNEVADEVVEQDVEVDETETESAPDKEVESAGDETDTSDEGDGAVAEQPSKKGSVDTKGILRDLQEERERRRKAEEAAERTAREVAELKEQFNAKIASENVKVEEDIKLADDDLTTFGSIKKYTEKMIREKLEPMAKKIAMYEQKMFQDNLLNSEAAARREFSADKVGADLAYDKVFEEGTKEMVKINPGYVEVIRQSKNPAETAYEIGLLHPKFKNMIRKSQSEQVIDKINAPKAVTGRTGAGKSGGINAKTASIQDFIKMSDEELDKLARES
ncbi:MAG TPA: hypothetical protein PLZ78_08820 [Spirochaetota bacterium]|nr:hypothetical protein [Spirochaetota bacterium]